MMAKKSKIDEDCEDLSIAADPWNLKLKPAILKGMPFLSQVHSGLALVPFS